VIEFGLNLLQQSKLMKFGYLPQSNHETGELRREEDVIDGLKRMQVKDPFLPFFCDCDELEYLKIEEL